MEYRILHPQGSLKRFRLGSAVERMTCSWRLSGSSRRVKWNVAGPGSRQQHPASPDVTPRPPSDGDLETREQAEQAILGLSDRPAGWLGRDVPLWVVHDFGEDRVTH